MPRSTGSRRTSTVPPWTGCARCSRSTSNSRRQARLCLAHIAAAYDWTITSGATPYGRNVHLQDAITAVLTHGVEQGDVRTDLNMQEIVDLLMAAYAWTWRLVAWDGADAKAMIGVMDRQITLIAEGFAPRS